MSVVSEERPAMLPLLEMHRNNWTPAMVQAVPGLA